MPFQLPELSFSLNALDPFVSEEQMFYHYNKHHAAYFTNLNKLIDGKSEADLDLREIVKKSSGGLFNNSAQAWNHSFFWNCLSPSGGGKPNGEIAELIARDFGSFEDFKRQFSEQATKLFGSGWAWLAKDSSGKLEIMPLGNADTPLKHDREPIMTLDVWEHAYYIDYRNERPRFIEGFWDVVNWDFASQCLSTPFAGNTKT